MRRHHKSLIVLAGLVALMATSAVAGSADWFDMKNCGMCKHWGENMEMLQNSTWEQHEISNGFVSLSSVKEPHLADYRQLCAKSDKIGKKLMAGEKMDLCGSCETMGSFFPRGARMEKVETQSGMVMLVTSDDPEVVADMHTWVKRNNEEMKKMQAEFGAK